MTTQITWQVAGKAFDAYAKEKPEWVQMGLRGINRWGTGVILQHAIGELLEEAYAMGVAGTPPTYTPPDQPAPSTVIRRQRPAPTPPPAPANRIRRTR
jgi:hypothetical protein